MFGIFKKKGNVKENKEKIAMVSMELLQGNGTGMEYESVTNRELCITLEDVDRKACEFETSVSKREMQEALSECEKLLEHAYVSVNGSLSDGRYRNVEVETLRPLSARQGYNATKIMDMLSEGRFLAAFHELHDAIDDFGWQHKTWDGEYRKITYNEYVLFSVLIKAFQYNLSRYEGEYIYQKNKIK